MVKNCPTKAALFRRSIFFFRLADLALVFELEQDPTVEVSMLFHMSCICPRTCSFVFQRMLSN